MPTPNVDSGVTERTKPLLLPSNVVYRREQSLARGATLFTPVFDLGRDGYPMDEAEQASLSVGLVSVPSPYMRILVALSASASSVNPGGVIFVYNITDSATINVVTQYYVQPRSGATTQGGANVFRWEMTGRRCMFAIQNAPLGRATALIQAYRVEIVSEG